MDTLKTTHLILMALPLIVLSVIGGMIIAYSFPEGFPGASGPPADQKQTTLNVGIGELDSNQDWLRGMSFYLVPFAGIRGERSYSALIFVPGPGQNFSMGQPTELYLEAKNMDVVQPVEIDADDLVEWKSNHIVVKLLDEGPNSGQYYRNVHDLTLNGHP